MKSIEENLAVGFYLFIYLRIGLLFKATTLYN